MTNEELQQVINVLELKTEDFEIINNEIVMKYGTSPYSKLIPMLKLGFKFTYYVRLELIRIYK